MTKEKPSAEQKLYTEADVIRLLGWLSADIRALRSFEVPKLLDAWERYKMEVLSAPHDERMNKEWP